MQEKTINSALLALERDDGVQGNLARSLLILRGVRIPLARQSRKLRRGVTRRMASSMLEEGPKTTRQIGARIREAHPEISARSANNRAYQCLSKLLAIRIVVQDFGPDGYLWRLEKQQGD